MKLGRDTASLTNALMDNTAQKPLIGMGATVLAYTDRYAGTIVEVTDKKIVVQEDFATRTDSNGMSEHQEYVYKPNENGLKFVFTLRRNGKWTEEGEKAGHGRGLLIGERDKYYDFGF